MLFSTQRDSIRLISVPSLFILVVLSALSAANLEAQGGSTVDRWGTQSFEINPFIGLLNDQPEFSPDLNTDQLRRDAIIGGRLGYTFGSNIFFQVEASNSLIQILYPLEEGGNQARNTNTFFGGGAIGYNIQPAQDIQVFGVVGAGAVLWDAELAIRETQLRFNYGLGARYFVGPKLAVRTDVRMHHIPSALEKLRAESAGGAVADGNLFALELSVGISLFTHGSTDGDRDGVSDRVDTCPGSRPGVIVDGKGCPLDSDGDGVPDGIDQCPNTPRGVEVGLNGCPTDRDPEAYKETAQTNATHPRSILRRN